MVFSLLAGLCSGPFSCQSPQLVPVSPTVTVHFKSFQNTLVSAAAVTLDSGRLIPGTGEGCSQVAVPAIQVHPQWTLEVHLSLMLNDTTTPPSAPVMTDFQFFLLLLLCIFMCVFCLLAVRCFLHFEFTFLLISETWLEYHGHIPGAGFICFADLFCLIICQAAIIFFFLDEFEIFSYPDDLI